MPFPLHFVSVVCIGCYNFVHTSSRKCTDCWSFWFMVQLETTLWVFCLVCLFPLKDVFSPLAWLYLVQCSTSLERLVVIVDYVLYVALVCFYRLCVSLIFILSSTFVFGKQYMKHQNINSHIILYIKFSTNRRCSVHYKAYHNIMLFCSLMILSFNHLKTMHCMMECYPFATN